MKRVLLGSAVVLFAFCLSTVGRAGGQEAASLQIGTPSIRQAEHVSFLVDLDEAPSVDGGTTIKFAPNGDLTKQIIVSTGISAGAKRAEPSTTIPLDAPIGTWKVTEISFQANGVVQHLTISGKRSFKVSKHEPLILPHSAVVRVQ